VVEVTQPLLKNSVTDSNFKFDQYAKIGKIQ